MNRPTTVKCHACSGGIDVKPRGRVPQYHPECKKLEDALVRVEKLLDGHKVPETAEGHSSLSWIRSRLWRAANTLNPMGVPTRIRPRKSPVTPIRMRNSESPEDLEEAA